MPLQPSRERVECRAAAWSGPQILVHRQPCPKLHFKRVGKDTDQIGIAGRQSGLTNTDTEAGTDSGKLSQMAVARNVNRACSNIGIFPAHHAQYGRSVPVETDQAMPDQVFQASGVPCRSR